MKKKEDPNVKHDARHLHARGVATPPAEGTVDVVRCENCQRLATAYEINMIGRCPDCANVRFRGAVLKKFPSGEWFRIMGANVLKHWTVHGKNGWGWERARNRELKLKGVIE